MLLDSLLFLLYSRKVYTVVHKSVPTLVETFYEYVTFRTLRNIIRNVHVRLNFHYLYVIHMNFMIMLVKVEANPVIPQNIDSQTRYECSKKTRYNILTSLQILS